MFASFGLQGFGVQGLMKLWDYWVCAWGGGANDGYRIPSDLQPLKL